MEKPPLTRGLFFRRSAPPELGGSMWAICYRRCAPPELGGSMWAICYRRGTPLGLDMALLRSLGVPCWPSATDVAPRWGWTWRSSGAWGFMLAICYRRSAPPELLLLRRSIMSVEHAVPRKQPAPAGRHVCSRNVTIDYLINSKFFILSK
jgi:hypothetical protein